MRLRPLLHPSNPHLLAYADKCLPHEERLRVASHLLRCNRCREVVSTAEWIARARLELPAPIPSPASIDHVLRRRAMGERVILRTEDPRSGALGQRRAALAAAAVLVMCVGILALLRAPTAAAGSTAGTLRLQPMVPGPNAIVRVEFAAPAYLASEPMLILRGRYRVGSNARSQGQKVVALLESTGSGTFRGEFQLPDSVWYGVFVVEDTAATRIDTNNGRSWELILENEDGRPAFEGLRQQWMDLHDGSFARALAAAERATGLYPGRAEGWNSLLFYQSALVSGSALDSLLQRHGQQFTSLHESLARRPNLDGLELRSMLVYATKVGDSARAAFWRERLLEEAPHERRAIEARMADMYSGYWNSAPQALLDSLEVFWEQTRATSPAVPQQGLVLAHRVQDPDLVRRWAGRLLEQGLHSSYAIRTMLEYPELRELALETLRSRLRADARAENRPLDQTLPEYLADVSAQRGRDLGDLGRGLLAAGKAAAAADSLRKAVELTWSAELFREAARALLVTGDTARAATVTAWAAVDAEVRGTTQDSMVRQMENRIGREQWHQMLDVARTEMRSRTLARSSNVPLPREIRLASADGARLHLRSLLAGKTSVVVFWSRYCGHSLEELPYLVDLVRQMETLGIPVAVIAEGPREASLAYLRETDVRLTLYFDEGGEANDAFRSWETPTYYVVDASGRLRFSRVPRAQIHRHVNALQGLDGGRALGAEPQFD